jgi:ribosomal protein S18 acetylase RimI-like enzyme
MIRPANLGDAPAIAALHDQVWRETYRDLATPEAWAALTAQLRLARWREILADPDPQRLTLLAEKGGRLLGFGTVCAPTEAVFDGRGEVRWLHIAAAARRTGLGRAMMAALAAKLGVWGYEGCALAVVVGNDPAIGFYQALGGREIGRYVDPGPLWRSENIVFAWDDLSILAPAAAIGGWTAA